MWGILSCVEKLFEAAIKIELIMSLAEGLYNNYYFCVCLPFVDLLNV